MPFVFHSFPMCSCTNFFNVFFPVCSTTTAPVTTPASTTAHNLDNSGKFICNFGTTTNADECIADDYTADFNWQIYAGATGSSSTGPTNDHTTGTSTGENMRERENVKLILCLRGAPTVDQLSVLCINS